MTDPVGLPFAPGSVSLRLYPHLDLAAPAIIDELLAQAALASENGFDGVMTSEHHGGFAGYLPNPLQAAGWLLDAMTRGWAAACPLLLPVRPPALVAEEVAWLATRYPGRVGVGVAAGALAADFEAMGSTMDDLTTRFAAGLATLTAMLRGEELGPLAGDPALAACARNPVPVLSAASSKAAARRAAAFDAGVLFDSLATPRRCRELSDAYRAAGGVQPVVLVRRVWVGAPPNEQVDAQLDVYRTYAPAAAPQHWGSNEMVADDDITAIADTLVEIARAAGADALNLRVHVPGVAPAAAREQIVELGTHVVGRVQDALARH